MPAWSPRSPTLVEESDAESVIDRVCGDGIDAVIDSMCVTGMISGFRVFEWDESIALDPEARLTHEVSEHSFGVRNLGSLLQRADDPPLQNELGVRPMTEQTFAERQAEAAMRVEGAAQFQRSLQLAPSPLRSDRGVWTAHGSPATHSHCSSLQPVQPQGSLASAGFLQLPRPLDSPSAPASYHGLQPLQLHASLSASLAVDAMPSMLASPSASASWQTTSPLRSTAGTSIHSALTPPLSSIGGLEERGGPPPGPGSDAGERLRALDTSIHDTNSVYALNDSVGSPSGLSAHLGLDFSDLINVAGRTPVKEALLSDDQVRNLPRVCFEDPEMQTCSICLEAFRHGMLLTGLGCGHAFHVNCLAQWVQRSAQCPNCRTAIEPG